MAPMGRRSKRRRIRVEGRLADKPAAMSPGRNHNCFSCCICLCGIVLSTNRKRICRPVGLFHFIFIVCCSRGRPAGLSGRPLLPVRRMNSLTRPRRAAVVLRPATRRLLIVYYKISAGRVAAGAWSDRESENAWLLAPLYVTSRHRRFH